MSTRPGFGVALSILVLLVGAACGGGDTTPLTSEEYASALEKTHSDLRDGAEKIQEEFQKALEDPVEVRLRRLVPTLASDGPWSDDEIEAVREWAEALSHVFTKSMEETVGLVGDYRDMVSALRPPEHLADLHDALVAGYDEGLEALEGLVRQMKDIDTDIESQEDYRDFVRAFSSVDYSGPESGSDVDETCFEIQDRLEEELGREVAICF